MLPVRQCRYIYHISDFDRCRIIGIREASQLGEIGWGINCDPITVARIWSRWSEEVVRRYHLAGTPNLSPRRNKFLDGWHTHKNDFKQLGLLFSTVREFFTVTTTTYKTSFFGLHSYRPNEQLALTAAYNTCMVLKAAILGWLLEQCSDESRFCFWVNYDRSRVRWCQEEKRSLQLTEGPRCVQSFQVEYTFKINKLLICILRFHWHDPVTRVYMTIGKVVLCCNSTLNKCSFCSFSDEFINSFLLLKWVFNWNFELNLIEVMKIFWRYKTCTWISNDIFLITL